VTKDAKAERHVVVIARPVGSNWARVLCGVLVDRTGDAATLTNCRQALYYARESGGELGLAAHGPRGECRITAAVSRVEVTGVGFVADCSEAAVTAWRDAPVYAGK
jgi:hypothetical protein